VSLGAQRLTGNMEGGWILTAEVQLNPGTPIFRAYGCGHIAQGIELVRLQAANSHAELRNAVVPLQERFAEPS